MHVPIVYVLHKIIRSFRDFLDYIWCCWSIPNFEIYFYLPVYANRHRNNNNYS